MTIEEKLKEMLIEHGMWPDQATRVLDKAKKAEGNKAMLGRWQHDVEGYLPSLLAVLWLSIRDVALEDIDANCPKAWFRDMFVKEATE